VAGSDVTRRTAIAIGLLAVPLVAAATAAGWLWLQAPAVDPNLRRWVVTADMVPGWARTLPTGDGRWEVSEPAPGARMVEHHHRGERAGFYTAGIRETSVAAAATTAAAWTRAQLVPFDDARIERAPLGALAQATRITAVQDGDRTTTVVVARRGHAVVVVNATGLPALAEGTWQDLLERCLAAIAAGGG